MIDLKEFSDAELRDKIINRIKEERFSCVGAKAAVSRKGYQIEVFDELAEEESSLKLYKSLKGFVSRLEPTETSFSTFIACFRAPQDSSKEVFEAQLWRQLKLLSQLDEEPWNETVSKDVDAPNFAFSLAGEAFFVLGLHPHSERGCRRFAAPCLVFNSHRQFKALRKKDVFELFKKRIREREIKFYGSINPNIADFGDASEARQYSGNKASSDWRCPVRFD